MDNNVTKGKVLNGLFWSFLDRGGDQILRFFISLILARLLLPEMFGLIAMIMVIFDIAQQIVNGGFGLAIINKKDHTFKDECAVFFFNIVMSLVCCVIIFFVAPLVAKFYNQAKLCLIIRVLSISFLASSFGTIQFILMMKKMDFKRQALISMTATIVSGSLGVGFALGGFGVWSLVIQLIARSTVGSVLVWSFYSWRPALVLNIKSLFGLFSYGSKMFLSDITTIIFNNLYNIIIGKFYNASVLAFFWRGRQLQQLPCDSIWMGIGRVAFPTFPA